VNVRLNNHVSLIVSYNADTEDAATNGPVSIVQFEVIPSSVAYDGSKMSDDKPDQVPASCPPTGGESSLIINGGNNAQPETVVWTYSVEWKRSTSKWNTRWDIFLHEEGDDQIHWFSIINSLMIVLFLTGIVAVIMLKTVSADFRKYRELETQEEAQEETGWKLVHGDVFRPPAHEMLLSVFVGNGVQVLTMTGLTLLVALLGFLSPANRGALLTAVLVLYALMGMQAGYVSARLYKLMKGTQWKRNTVQTALLVPGVVLSVFFTLNLVLAYQKSSAAIGFFRLFTIAFLWVGVSVPLVFVGA
jgi:transmembrane 9 superfamily protein 2/4